MPGPEQLHEKGYCILNGMYDQSTLRRLQMEVEQLIDRCYNQEQLDRHSVYPSDATQTRVSHAVMLAEAASELPTVEHRDFPVIDQFLRDYISLLGSVTGTRVPDEARTMLNYQNYFSGSKPVGEHFDGEYLRTERAADGIEFSLIEGILPRYVAVLVVANENEGRGTELVDASVETVYEPTLDPGDLLFFDNIRLRHRVPRLERPRTTIGLRNFDHQALHFARSQTLFMDGDYRRIPEGWVSEDADCQGRLRRFMTDEWPGLREQYAHYF